MSESDGVVDAFQAELRAVLMAASQIASVASREISERARVKALTTSDAAGVLQKRHAAEQKAAEGQLAVVRQPDWWESATAADVAVQWRTAQAWAPTSAEAEAAAETIREQTLTRHGVDISQVDLAARQTGEASLDRAAATRLVDEAAVTTDVVVAEAALEDADRFYDSAERREEDAAALLAAGVAPAAVEAHQVVDVSNAYPGTDAVKVSPNKQQARAKKPRATQQRQRADRGR